MIVTRQPKLVTSLVRLTAVAVAMLMLTVLIVSRSDAAFSATTDNTANSFTTGSVVLTDDDAGVAMFNAVAMTPGVPVVECIELEYTGTLVPADIRTYATSGGTLAAYLDTTIEVGNGGLFGNCAGFTPSATIFNSTLSSFSTTHTDWTSGLATFTATTPTSTAVLRFTVDVQNVPAAQGQTASAAFTFEAQD